MNPAREFSIEHADKVEQFLEISIELEEEKTSRLMLNTPGTYFKESGPLDELVSKIQMLVLDTEIIQCLLSGAGMAAKKSLATKGLRNSVSQDIGYIFGKLSYQPRAGTQNCTRKQFTSKEVRD